MSAAPHPMTEPGDDSGMAATAGETWVSLALAMEDKRWDTALGDPEAFISKTLDEVALRFDFPADFVSELSVTLSDDETVREINREWREKDKPTNVLSFPMVELEPGDRPGPLVGDLILAFETCEREALSEAKPFVNHARHLLVHGFLHCLGYDHIEDDEAEEMEALETSILAGFGIPDPYDVADLDPSRDNRDEGKAGVA
ncbi:rRNA maturation RNase YbeY [Fulvimarina sp. MAC3]|uniref:rRNA maturation RNase YbeY n=1 Tax=Fulvimarina sp. MAC3 TaxID=3148887 RepID=UPI0031FC1891